MSWIFTNAPQASEWDAQNIGTGTGSRTYSIEWDTPLSSIGQYLEYYQNPQLNFLNGTDYQLEYTINVKFVSTTWPNTMHDKLRLTITMYNSIGEKLEFISSTNANDLGMSSPQLTDPDPGNTGIEVVKTVISISEGSAFFDGLGSEVWGRMFVELTELPPNTGIEIEKIAIDNFKLSKVISTITTTTPASLQDWSDINNWTVVAGEATHSLGTDGWLVQDIDLVKDEKYQLSMDLEYLQNTGTTNASRVYLPNTVVIGEQYIEGESEPGGQSQPGYSIPTYGHLYLTPDNNKVEAVWVQGQDQNKFRIKQDSIGSAKISDIQLKKIKPYGGDVESWDLVGDSDDIYWLPSTPFGHAEGHIKMDGGDRDTLIKQDITHLTSDYAFSSGKNIKISFRVSDYVDGEITCHAYNDSGDGIMIDGIVSDGLYEFSDTIVTGKMAGTDYYSPDLLNTFAITCSSGQGAASSATTLSIDNISFSIHSGQTVTFKEDVTGWVSFKSFVPEQANSVANNYYTILDGKLYKHYDESVDRNTFYGTATNSSLNVILNDAPGVVKSFHTLDYEGSQSKIDQLVTYGTTSLVGVETGSNLFPITEPALDLSPNSNATLHDYIISPPANLGSFTIWSFNANTTTGEVDSFNIPILDEVGANLNVNKKYKLEFDYDIHYFDPGVHDGTVHIVVHDTLLTSILSPNFLNPLVDPYSSGKELTGSGSTSIDYQPYSGNQVYISIYHPYLQTGLTGGVHLGVSTGYFVTLNNISFKELSFTTTQNENQFYNLIGKDGWYVSDIETDKQKGSLNEFIEKEGKWFNYIKGVDYNIGSTTDFEAFNIQGLGKVVGGEIGSTAQPQQYYLEFKSINVSLQVGDIIYYSTTDINGPYTTIDTDNITKLGDVLAINGNTIIVRPIDMYSLETGTIPSPQLNDYFMFTKNQVVNTSSLVGYYADVRFENNSKEKAEIFSVNSEITESSK